MRYLTWVEIDLAAVERNIRTLAEIIRAALMVVVKADGYGHGAVQVAETALAAGASSCAVARVEEALQLRRAGIAAPVLVMGLTPADMVEDAVRERISLTIWSVEALERIQSAARRVGQNANLHLKINTGMNRLGCSPAEVVGLATAIQLQDGLALEGVYTHFACADQQGAQANQEQLNQFLDSLAALEGEGIRPKMVHAANSSAALSIPEARFDSVRVGIAMYGLEPFEQPSLPEGMQPALAWKAQITQIRKVPAGSGISYGHEYRAVKDELIGTLPVGYGDGFRRQAGNEVLVRGRLVPTVGRICMDQCLVQLDAVPEARAGDEVVLIGAQDGSAITAEAVANRWDTINYEVTCGISSRVPRIYSG